MNSPLKKHLPENLEGAFSMGYIYQNPENTQSVFA